MQALRRNLGLGLANAAKSGGIIARRTTVSPKNKDSMIMVTRSSGGLPDLGPNYSKMPRKFGVYDLEKSRVPFDVDTLDVLDNDAHISNLDILKGFGLFGVIAFVWPYSMWIFFVKGKHMDNPSNEITFTPRDCIFPESQNVVRGVPIMDIVNKNVPEHH
eukprot:TRINITY_DN21670_c0_g1_i1.p1 TRINITY_DN21670_c0_g1~~TRINITY_DN21670_c0_g1_i1.p1  ORF type:complete len:160 (-),score=41.33 TRINITY_DN21670_c0_g1_i1:174-653(-)